MAKMLRKDAGNYLRKNGFPFLTDHHLYSLVRENKIPSYRAGNRLVIDTDIVAKFIENEMEASVEQDSKLA